MTGTVGFGNSSYPFPLCGTIHPAEPYAAEKGLAFVGWAAERVVPARGSGTPGTSIELGPTRGRASRAYLSCSMLSGQGAGCNGRSGALASLHDNFQLHGANLDNVVLVQGLLLPWGNSSPVDICAVGAVQILDHQVSMLASDQSVLTGRPDPIRWLLVFNVYVHRLLISSTDKVLPFVEREFQPDLEAAYDMQASLGMASWRRPTCTSISSCGWRGPSILARA